KYRRAFWFTFDSNISKYKYNLIRIISGLITICSIITSLTFIEITNNLFINNDYQEIFFIKKTLTIEIFILIFFYIELFLCYFIRPKLQFPTLFLILINIFSLIPISLLLFIWPISPTWLYTLLVIQYVARIFRSVRLSSYAYQIMYDLTDRLSIYFETFQSVALIILFFALFILSIEQISVPVEFLINKNLNNTNYFQSIVFDTIV
ncbi:unnamed protein product, partial [Rotaria sp. Silwood2]